MGTGVFAWFSWPPSARDGLSESESDRAFLRFVCVNRDGVSVSCVSRFGSDPTCDTVIYGTKLGHKTHTG